MCETLCKPESKNVICPVTQHSTAVTEHGVKCVRACLSPPLIFSFTSLKSSPPKAKVLDLQSSSYDTLFEAKNIWLRRLFNLLYTLWFLYFFFFFSCMGPKWPQSEICLQAAFCCFESRVKVFHDTEASNSSSSTDSFMPS